MNKEIEEMAKVISDNYCEMFNDGQGQDCGLDCDVCRARRLHEQGYRQCKDKIMLTREEFEKIYNQARNEMACAIVRAVFDEIDWSKDTKTFETYILNLANEYSMLETIEEEIRKDTAEKDFNTIIKALEIKKASIITHYGVKESVGADVAIRTVKELAKQFGVEIKE
jgi:endonuclease V-like protein UPF0215 family